MLFKAEHIEPIQRRKKTQTRRAGRKRWIVGNCYQCRTSFRKEDKPFAYIRVTDLREEFLGQISDKDARKEGYPHVPAYKKAFKRIYGGWDPHQLVWVIDFVKINEEEYLQQRGKKIS